MNLSLVQECAKDFPIYHKLIDSKIIPVLEKIDISKNFPNGWLSPSVKNALEKGEAEYVRTTGTNHDRMTLIRPPFFLMKQYFKIWSKHPELYSSWDNGCTRISLTTIRATQHVTKEKQPSVKDRTFAGRALYLNCCEDPCNWDYKDMQRMTQEVKDHAPYHLDGDPVYIAYFIKKLKEYHLWEDFPKPETIIHAYEFCSGNVSRFIHDNFDCPIVNLFGSTELGFLFATSKPNPFVSYFSDLDLELIPISPNKNIFSLVVTSFRNPYMPLIRYKSGDCVETFDGSRNPEKIKRICGRELELFRGKDDTLIAHGNLDNLIKDHFQQIFQYQVRLYDHKLCFVYSTFDDSRLGSCLYLKKVLEDTFKLSCELEWSESIEPGGSGKYFWLKDMRKK